MIAISRKFHDFIGHPGDVVNKACLCDDGMSQPGAPPGFKIIRCLVDYNTKMEKLLKEMRTLLQPAKQRQESEPAQQPTPPPVTTPVAQSEAPVAPTETADPTLQEPISESLNTENIALLE